MKLKASSAVLILFFAFIFSQNSVAADERDEEITELKTQVQGLLKRIEKLEAEQMQTKQDTLKAKEEAAKVSETTKAAPCKVDLEKIASKLKIKGRWAAGYYKSDKSGSYPSGSFEAPEAKLQFGFEPDEINKIIIRMNLNNFAFTNLDYFYVDTKLSKYFNLPFELNSRLGRLKLDFGEETWSNNPVESVLASNSAGNVSGSDEGLQLSGKPFENIPLNYSFSVTDGATGEAETSTAKAFTGKLAYNIIDPLYVSASYYTSGSMKNTNAEMGIGGLAARPNTTNTLNWRREIWEVDLRYDFEKGKILIPAFCDSKAFIRMAYGAFSDDASGAAERSGSFGFVEGTYNLTPKIYAASRISVIDLDSDTTASLNGVTSNEYQRYSFGLGYRLTSNTLFKLGYDINDESGPSVDDSDNNLISAIVASQF